MTQPTKINTETIAASRDVELVIGKPATLKLLVSSSILRSASKVFAALLGPNFPEGQNLGSCVQPKDISLPDDNATAMCDICMLIHGKQVGDLLKAPGIDRILAFATLVDKYDCADALLLQSQAILLADIHYFAKTSFDALAKQMVAAYLLKHALAFRVVTKRLIGETAQGFVKLSETTWGSFFPVNVLCKTQRMHVSTKMLTYGRRT